MEASSDSTGPPVASSSAKVVNLEYLPTLADILRLRRRPPPSYNFPTRSFGLKRQRLVACKDQYFDEYAWLDYDQTNDVVLCQVCKTVLNSCALRFSLCCKAEPAFTTEGEES